MMRDVIFLGPPGSGKGTVGKFIAAARLGHHLSTGEIIRRYLRHLPANDDMHARIALGQYLTDDEITALLIPAVGEAGRSRIIFDGYPRTNGQVPYLEDIEAKYGRIIHAVILFRLDDEHVMERITGRYNCADCQTVWHRTFNPAPQDTCTCGSTSFETRTDDRAEVVSARLGRYHEKTGPLVDHYHSIGLVREIDASRPIDAVVNAALHACG